MTDTRDNPTVKPIIKINPRKQHNGAEVVWLNNLTAERRQQLANGMEKSEKGQLQLAVMKEARVALGELMHGAIFSIPKDEFEQYMKDGEA